MTIPHYGVWAAIPTSFKAQTKVDDSKSPHITLKFKDDPNASRELQAAINVKSTDRDTRLVYWFVKDFKHPITDALANLDLGFHLIRPNDSQTGDLALDYIRTQPELMTLEDGRILEHDIPGPNNDILDEMKPILQTAIDKNNGATVYLFGSSFGSGIHDIHMNQGSLPRFDNGVNQDGGILFNFPNDGHWEAIFLAFASQKYPTDNKTGRSLPDSESFAERIQQE
ncbi:uncharacterized protein K441DRAFT_569540 [Cenococcum geophilum 1.58]|uniref:uncharacterized protein n=1 Tax=Cenococcum geophilum 1.58 TaxID=794803 RepID=UPI00358F2C67|nr:hypothetical protein K441DRAFT_569540 [Cenococcum geophilum 1.58]